MEAIDDDPGLAGTSGGPSRDHRKLVSLGRLVHEVAATLIAGTSAISAPTGFADLYHLTGGVAPGALWVISGRSGAGKSILVTDLIRSAAVRGGQGTLLVTRSETPAQVVHRLLAAEAKVPLQHMAFGLSNEEGLRLRKAEERLRDVPLVLLRAEELDLPAIAALLVSHSAEDPLRLLLVDDLPSGLGQVQAAGAAAAGRRAPGGCSGCSSRGRGRPGAATEAHRANR